MTTVSLISSTAVSFRLHWTSLKESLPKVRLKIQCRCNVPAKSKLQHPIPGQQPGHLNFLKICVHIPLSQAKKLFKCPTIDPFMPSFREFIHVPSLQTSLNFIGLFFFIQIVTKQQSSLLKILKTQYSQLSPGRHPAITDTRYYGQNSDPHL